MNETDRNSIHSIKDVVTAYRSLADKVDELVEGYNENRKRYDDLCKVIGFFGSQYDKLIKRLEVLKILQSGEMKAE